MCFGNVRKRFHFFPFLIVLTIGFIVWTPQELNSLVSAAAQLINNPLTFVFPSASMRYCHVYFTVHLSLLIPSINSEKYI